MKTHRMESRRKHVTAAAFAVAIGFFLLPVCTGTACADEEPQSGDRTAAQFFYGKVLPLLENKCFACHGKDDSKLQGEYHMTSREALLRGGESGDAAVIPGRPDESPLFRAVNREGLEMPPKENDRLDTAQIEILRRWIEMGAPWPEKPSDDEPWSPVAGDGVRVTTSGGLSDTWTSRPYDPANLWAYRPLWKDVEGRLHKEASRGRNPIDVLIGDRIGATGIEAAPRADRRTLIRRATFDLVGLPPAPEDVESFINDPANDDDAFAKVIERLLESPHYGEQWGRHWLDVVRYADSSGYANDYERGNAWRYRDYVIRAFNSDKPYDDFIREQIAGDELAESKERSAEDRKDAAPNTAPDFPSPPERGEGPRRADEGSTRTEAGSPPSAELLIAAGFLRMGPWELTGMEVPKIARQRFLDDVTDGVSQVFLAHMLQCCRCHDHKFDPIPTRDYYSMQAVFATTQLAERSAPFLPEENLDGFEERRHLEKRQQFYDGLLREVSAKTTIEAARQWFVDEGRDATQFNETLEKLKSEKPKAGISVSAIRNRMAEDGIDPALIPPRHVGFEPQDFGLERIGRKGIQRLAWRMERYEPFALTVYSGRTPNLKNVSNPTRMPGNRMNDGQLEQTHILTGGDPFSAGQAVTPAVLSVVATSPLLSYQPDSPEPDSPEPDSPEPDRSSDFPSPLERGEGAQRADEGSTGTIQAPFSVENEEGRSDGLTATAGIPATITGRRLALANWIASPDNPLTARVMVNRIWQWHFGTALAGNPNNFGATGKKPTHPELLDHLAARFIEAGWSVKAMHRLIMTSDAYRRSSRHSDRETLAKLDPDGTSYAVFRPRRLDAEELRDALLSVSGELNPEVGGIPVRPEMNLEAALQPRMVMGTFAEAWQPSVLPEDRHRRSIYVLRLRGLRDPFFEVFNAPSPEFSCEAREASTVTPQVFSLFNGKATYLRALAMADRLIHESVPRPSGSGPSESLNTNQRSTILRRAFQFTHNRVPSEQELAACLTHWNEMEQRHATLMFKPQPLPSEVVREAVEENTGEKFTFTEPLEAAADFVPDLQPSDCHPEVRALAEVCLVLLNSNEFAYVY